MFCPYCNCACRDQDRFCSNCGAPLSAVPREKKGRHWVPILIMGLILTFGITLFFLFPGSSGESGLPADRTPWFRIDDDGVLYFRQSDYSGGSELLIPESVNGITVTSLGEGCFENCTELTSVILPSALQAIGEDAFRGCTALRGIEIPASVVLIGEDAFSGCTALEAVCVYDGIRSIGDGAFSGCSKLFYIYYSGYFEDWHELYDEFINPYTTVSSLDGTFYQGERAD